MHTIVTIGILHAAICLSQTTADYSGSWGSARGNLQVLSRDSSPTLPTRYADSSAVFHVRVYGVVRVLWFRDASAWLKGFRA